SFTDYENVLSCEPQNDDKSFSIYSSECKNFNGLDLLSNTCKSSDVCNAVSKFLNKLQGKNKDSYAENGFKYMYYWLYVDVLKRAVNHYDTIKLYKELIDKYEEQGWHIIEKCKKQLNEKNSDNLIKLFTLYNDFNKLNSKSDDKCKFAKECADTYMRYIGESHICDDKDFCNELENFKDKYEHNMKNISCSNGAPKTLPTTRKNELLFTISVPIFVMLLISFIGIFLYKVNIITFLKK
ncbi:hypothetical protein PCYB_003900, partial [Plasmodium cynomolgi strain B]